MFKKSEIVLQFLRNGRLQSIKYIVDRNVSFFISTAPSPPAPDQSRHNIEEAVRYGKKGEGYRQKESGWEREENMKGAGQHGLQVMRKSVKQDGTNKKRYKTTETTA